MKFLKPPHPLTNFEIQKYYKSEPKLMVVFQEIIYLKKVKDGAYITNFDEYAGLGTHWIALFCKKKMTLFISIVLTVNIFLKKLNNLLKNFLEIKI